MFKYGRLYSGVDPEFIEDDVFRIIQPLNENYSFDAEIAIGMSGQKSGPDAFPASVEIVVVIGR